MNRNVNINDLAILIVLCLWIVATIIMLYRQDFSSRMIVTYPIITVALIMVLLCAIYDTLIDIKNALEKRG